MDNIAEPRNLGNGIYQIPAPLPLRSPAFVNIYLIEGGGGLLMLDCGSDWSSGREAIRSGFKALGLSEDAVHTLVVSHLHLDHVGMAGRMVDELGCSFVMHDRAEKLVDSYNDTPAYVSRLVRLGRTHGIPEQILESVSDFPRPDYMPLIPKPDTTVADGQSFELGAGRKLTVVHTPGHEPAHICLVDSKTDVTFSGDHVLPRISPVIMYDGVLDDPLGDYLNSLQKLINMGHRTHLPGSRLNCGTG